MNKKFKVISILALLLIIIIIGYFIYTGKEMGI